MPDVIHRSGPWRDDQVVRVKLHIIIRAIILLMDLRDPIPLLPCEDTMKRCLLWTTSSVDTESAMPQFWTSQSSEMWEIPIAYKLPNLWYSVGSTNRPKRTSSSSSSFPRHKSIFTQMHSVSGRKDWLAYQMRGHYMQRIQMQLTIHKHIMNIENNVISSKLYWVLTLPNTPTIQSWEKNKSIGLFYEIFISYEIWEY